MKKLDWRVVFQSSVITVFSLSTLLLITNWSCFEPAQRAEKAKVREPESPCDRSKEKDDETVTFNDVPQGPVKSDPVLSGPSETDEEAESGTEKPPKPKAGQLTAGRWSDVANWDFWTNLFGQGSDDKKPHKWSTWEKRWKFFTRRRFGVRVTRADGKPAVDAKVVMQDKHGNPVWTARTDNRGRAELFDGLFGESSEGPFKIVASSGHHQRVEARSNPPADGRVDIQLPSSTEPPRALDLMMVIDTTGSMSDEFRYIKSELGDVVERSQKYFGGELSIRTSVNLYRDEGDEYVVKTNPFRSEVAKAVADVDAEDSGGGGNYPEAVDQALARSINEHQWRDRATARLLFLVLDAPPHQQDEVIGKLHESIEAAAQKGVRIIPVASSGVNKSTEYVLRSFAISTGGTYTFLTDDSGIGGSHIEPTIGQHDVHYLNDLLVTVIHDYTKPVAQN